MSDEQCKQLILMQKTKVLSNSFLKDNGKICGKKINKIVNNDITRAINNIQQCSINYQKISFQDIQVVKKSIKQIHKLTDILLKQQQPIFQKNEKTIQITQSQNKSNQKQIHILQTKLKKQKILTKICSKQKQYQYYACFQCWEPYLEKDHENISQFIFFTAQSFNQHMQVIHKKDKTQDLITNKIECKYEKNSHFRYKNMLLPKAQSIQKILKIALHLSTAQHSDIFICKCFNQSRRRFIDIPIFDNYFALKRHWNHSFFHQKNKNIDQLKKDWPNNINHQNWLLLQQRLIQAKNYFFGKYLNAIREKMINKMHLKFLIQEEQNQNFNKNQTKNQLFLLNSPKQSLCLKCGNTFITQQKSLQHGTQKSNQKCIDKNNFNQTKDEIHNINYQKKSRFFSVFEQKYQTYKTTSQSQHYLVTSQLHINQNQKKEQNSIRCASINQQVYQKTDSIN